jgi:hypothetical protein
MDPVTACARVVPVQPAMGRPHCTRINYDPYKVAPPRHQLEEQPCVNSAEVSLPCINGIPHSGVVLVKPYQLCPGEVRIDNQTGSVNDLALQSRVLQSGADIDRSLALPDDSIAYRSTGPILTVLGPLWCCQQCCFPYRARILLDFNHRMLSNYCDPRREPSTCGRSIRNAVRTLCVELYKNRIFPR